MQIFHFFNKPTKIRMLLIILTAFIAVWQFGILKIAPTFNSDDSPETTTAFYTLGIQHPPGYPLNTLIGKIFTLIPAGNIMYRSNLTALVFNIITALLVFIFVNRYFVINKNTKYGNNFFAFISAALYLFCTTPFLQSLSAKGSIYTINAFFTIIIFLSLFNLKKHIKYFYLFSFVYGLSMGNHWQSMAVIFPAVLYYLIFNRKYFKTAFLLIGGIFFLLGASVYLFAFIRSQNIPVFAWGEIKTIRDLFWLISREQYRYAESAHSITDTFHLLWFYIKNLLTNEYPFYVVLFLIPGTYFLIKQFKTEAITISIAYIFIVVGIISISTPKPGIEWVIKPYFTSSYIFISIFISSGISFIINFLKKIDQRTKRNIYLAISTAIILPAFNATDYSRYFIGYDYAENIIKTLPEKSLFFTEGDLNMSSALYESFVNKKDFVFINTRLLEYDWYRKQLKNDYHDAIILPEMENSGTDYLYKTMMSNSEKGIYYSNAFTAEWQKLPFVPVGIVNRVLTGGNKQILTNNIFFDLYSYRGIIGDKINYDDFTNLLAVKHYAWSFITVADKLNRAGHYDTAIKLYKRSYLFLPSDQTLINIGSCYYNLGNTQNAEKYWNEALELNPKASYAYSYLAAIYLNRGETSKATEYVDNAIKFNSNNINAMQLKTIIDKKQSVMQ